MDKLFSNFELHDITGANVLTYSDLKSMSDGQFSSLLPMIVLYEVCDEYGHWICVFKNDEGINFFDSLGIIPDDELDLFENGYKPLLLKLIYNHSIKNNIDIIYNHRCLQKNKPYINTCGRYCILRLKFKDMYNDDFLSLFDKAKKVGIEPDVFVTMSTSEY